MTPTPEKPVTPLVEYPDPLSIAIVLRQCRITFGGVEQTALPDRSADTIERLTARNAELEAVLGEAREQFNDVSAITGNLEWRAELGRLVDRIDALARTQGAQQETTDGD